MIAVGVPAFNRQYLKNNTANRARILGVAGTDIPLEDLNKLSLPYKVNVHTIKMLIKIILNSK